MEKALACALILTKKHQQLNLQISKENSMIKRQELKAKQAEITQQIITFLEEMQEYKHLFILNTELENTYNYLVNYYSKEIYIKINQFQTKLNIMEFEQKMISNIDNSFKNNSFKSSQKIVKQKIKTYFQFFKKVN